MVSYLKVIWAHLLLELCLLFLRLLFIPHCWYLHEEHVIHILHLRWLIEVFWFYFSNTLPLTANIIIIFFVKLIISGQEDTSTFFIICDVFPEELDQNLDFVHVNELHAPWEFGWLVYECIVLPDVPRVHIGIELEQVPVVIIYLNFHLLFLGCLHTEQVRLVRFEI